MRVALWVVAGLALIGFLMVAVVLPRKVSADAKEAAQDEMRRPPEMRSSSRLLSRPGGRAYGAVASAGQGNGSKRERRVAA